MGSSCCPVCLWVFLNLSKNFCRTDADRRSSQLSFTTWAAMYTFVVSLVWKYYSWSSSICTRGLKVIQFQILFSLLLRKKTRFTKRFELKPSRLLICSRYFFLSSRWLKTIKDFAKGTILTPKKIWFCIPTYTKLTVYLTDYRLSIFCHVKICA